MQSQQTERRSSLAVWLAIAVVVLLPVAYALSIGPVQWLVNRGYIPEFVSFIYVPLWSFAAICEPFQTALWWYLAQWSVYPAPPR